MNYLQNHIWCSSSNWGGVHYDCRHLVSLSSYIDADKEDWTQLVDEDAEEFFDHERRNAFKAAFEKAGHEYNTYDDKIFYKKVKNFKPHVLEWLETIPDRKDPDCVKGWCIGSMDYRNNDSLSITVFFHRKCDAMAFIKKFSKYKKATNYCQYFTDVRKRLNLQTLKYETD